MMKRYYVTNNSRYRVIHIFSKKNRNRYGKKNVKSLASDKKKQKY